MIFAPPGIVKYEKKVNAKCYCLMFDIAIILVSRKPFEFVSKDFQFENAYSQSQSILVYHKYIQ